MRKAPPLSPSGRRNRASTLLLSVGVLLLGVGALLGSPSLLPYVASRLHPLPARQVLYTPTSSSIPPPPPTPTAPSEQPAGTPSPLPQAVQTEPSLPPTPPPSPTPAGLPPTRIQIPSIGVDAEVVPVGWQVTEVEGVLQPVWTVADPPLAGWHEGSALLGVPGNTVISGHNWPENGVFRDLYQVQPGEEVVLYSDRTPFVYQVTEVLLLKEGGQPLEVRLENARYALPTDDERVTLITCHPYGSLAYRLIVIARPGAPVPSDFGGE